MGPCVVCGKPNSPFGVGPAGDYRLVRDRPERIDWFCFEHWPGRPAKPACDPPTAATCETEKPLRRLEESWEGWDLP
jgi:hypothetical protein